MRSFTFRQGFKQGATPKDMRLRVVGALLAGFVTVSLAGCSGNDNAADPTSSGQSSSPTTSESSSPSSSPVEEPQPGVQKIKISVDGSKSTALIKALVITDESKDGKGKMEEQGLPYSKSAVVADDAEFLKVLVIAKYPDGDKGDISCDISVDGVSVDSNSSKSHKPAECVFVSK